MKMKRKYTKLFAFLGMSFLHGVHAGNPVSGVYGGLVLGGTYSPPVSFNILNPLSFESEKVTLKYSPFGNLGAQIGYRMENFRVEFELLGNNAPYRSFLFPTFQVNASKNSTGLRFQGSTFTIAAMVNAYYDLITCGGDTTNFFPYVGIGIGGARVENVINFYYDNVQIDEARFSENTIGAAAQGIVGLGYYLDDYTSFSLDFRYLSTSKRGTLGVRAPFAGVNLTINGSF